MKFQKLGNTDIDVSVVALGTWGLGGGSVWTDGDSTVEDAKHLLDICHEHGVNYIDTAPVYGTGVSEELLGKALKGRRNDFVLQTKCSLNWRNEGGNFSSSESIWSAKQNHFFCLSVPYQAVPHLLLYHIPVRYRCNSRHVHDKYQAGASRPQL